MVWDLKTIMVGLMSFGSKPEKVKLSWIMMGGIYVWTVCKVQ